MKTIKAGNKDIYILIDDEDYELVSQFKWFSRWRSGVIVRETGGRRTKKRVVRLDGLIIPHDSTKYILHINGKQEDCRKENLRVVTRAAYRTSELPYSKTGFKGVSLHCNRFQAHIRVNNKLIHLGTYIHPEYAALAYNAAALRYFDENCYLNDVDSLESKILLDYLRSQENDLKRQENGFKFSEFIYKLKKRDRASVE